MTNDKSDSNLSHSEGPGTTQKERELVMSLKATLDPQFKQIWTHKKISASPRFRKYIKGALGYIPILQPEFDLVFLRSNGHLNAIEVKYLNSTSKGYNLPYYLGIGQAMALQRFGFDYVGLWLLVGENVTDTVLNKYGAEAWTFIRKELQLSIEYSYIRVIESKGKTQFLVMKYTGKQTGIELLNVDDPNFLITWKNPNPLKDHEVAKKLRSGIELYLHDNLGS